MRKDSQKLLKTFPFIKTYQMTNLKKLRNNQLAQQTINMVQSQSHDHRKIVQNICLYLLFVNNNANNNIIGKMNRIFGFFKQKIIQVKQENKQQLQAFANSLTQNQYSTDRVLTLLQGMKANYMNWNILIANQASTGLYYSQLHNRNICLKKIKGNKDLHRQIQKNKMKLSHITETVTQIKQISQLNGKWMTSLDKELKEINDYIVHQKRKYQAIQINQQHNQNTKYSNQTKQSDKNTQASNGTVNKQEEKEKQEKEQKINNTTQNVQKIQQIEDD